MPPRKTLAPEALERKTYRVRVEPYFAVRVIDDPAHAHQTFLGKTAREALSHAKRNLITKGSPDQLLVVNGKLIEAIGWAAPLYPDDSDLLERVLHITGGILLD